MSSTHCRRRHGRQLAEEEQTEQERGDGEDPHRVPRPPHRPCRGQVLLGMVSERASAPEPIVALMRVQLRAATTMASASRCRSS